ncbi:MAG: MurR/RpiR family transcriptional regulator [Marinosulfonomonas sp.]
MAATAPVSPIAERSTKKADPMSILAMLDAKIETFTQGEKEIAQFVLADPDRAVQMSSASLAAETGRSQSSVVKFCQKLGYRGYQEFKLAVSQAAARAWSVPASGVHGKIESSDSYATTIQKLMGSKIYSIQQTLSANSETDIRACLDTISGARRIQLVGVGASSLVARDFGYKLQKLGFVIIFDADSHIQIANATTLGTEDVMIALSYSGTSLETLRIAQQAQDTGARLISITGLAPNPLSENADIRLYTVADDEKPRSSAITSRDAQLALADLLFIQLVQTLPGSNNTIQAAERSVSVLKS